MDIRGGLLLEVNAQDLTEILQELNDADMIYKFRLFYSGCRPLIMICRVDICEMNFTGKKYKIVAPDYSGVKYEF